jgi:hypothetical protein
MQRTALIFSLTMPMIMHPGGPASAQDWGEYVNIEERFGINIPGEPARTQETFRTASGLDFPAQVFTAFDGAGTYIVTVVRYSDLNHELFQTLLDDAVEAIRNRGGDVTYEGFNIYDGMDTISLQITNEDTSRSFYAITLPPRPSLTERLYIIEGRVGGSMPVPGHFQQSLFIVDTDGERIRYNVDIEGTRFRVIPGSGGQPLVAPDCNIALPCIPGRVEPEE